MLNRTGESRHSCLVCDLREKSFSLSPLTRMFTVDFSYIAFIMFRQFPSIPSLLSVYSWNGVELFKCFPCISWIDHVVSVLYSVDVVYYIDWFSYIEPSLYCRNESHFVMMYNLFNMLLNSYFVENVCINIHKGNWPEVFFSCSVFIWLWYQSEAGYRMNQEKFLPLQFFWKSLRRIGNSSSLNI